MLETQFSLSWEQHMQNISYGLSKFQQSGEFVDMTLAVDGYFVKVHQMIISLVSPYIKDIILSLKCTHPVIFLNNVSYKTLCSILDYVYKGEVQVSKDHLEDLIQAGKQLQIKGLQEMNPNLMSSNLQGNETTPTQCTDVKIEPSETTKDDLQTKELLYAMDVENIDIKNKEFITEIVQSEEMELLNNVKNERPCPIIGTNSKEQVEIENDSCRIINQDSTDARTPYFTLSNQGSLQLVLDRFIYFQKYNSTSVSNHCQWKCVNYKQMKCPAFVITRNDVVLQKVTTHTHPSHDMKIGKKIESGELYTSMRDAKFYAKAKRESNSKRFCKNKFSS